MTESTWELQKAIQAKLATLNYRAYEEPPPNAGFPYITHSDSDINFSDKGRDYQQYDYKVHLWSRYQGSKQIAEMKTAVQVFGDFLDSLVDLAF